ncbi:MAG TPA: hypothetical protein VHV83_01175 [Armatimonadota bacterium]|nr:hypothetical protein [Armatimonadota bacterium]
MLKSCIAMVNGNRMITIDGKSYIPAMYRSFRPTPSNVALFHRMGLKLYQMLCSGRKSTLGLPYSNYGEIWKGHNRYDFTAFDRQMAMFNRYAPDGYFTVMIQLDMPEWWMKSHPGVPDSFNNLGEAVFSKEWVEGASDYLKSFIAYSEEKYGDRVFAYSFSAGLATEWFDDARFDGSVSEVKQESYRRWLGDPAVVVPTREEI